jgi:hypothetical protein
MTDQNRIMSMCSTETMNKLEEVPPRKKKTSGSTGVLLDLLPPA